MRIVHVADYYMPTLGYQESILPRYHVKHGHEAHVVTSDRYTNVPNYDESWRPLLGPRFVGAREESQNGVYVHRLKGSFEHRTRIVLQGLAQKLADVKPDAIFGHGTTNYTAFQLARYARRLDIPLFLDCHMLFTVQDTSTLGRAFYRAMRVATARSITPSVSMFFGVAEESCDFLRTAQGIPASKVSLLPLGLDTDVFAPRAAEAASLRSSLGLGDDAIVVMQTGKLTPDKGPHLLTAALAPLMLDDPRIHLLLVGGSSSEYMSSIRRPLDSLGIQDRMLQLPLVPADRLAEYFSAADVVAFPAGSSLSCIEAAGCGTAVVMTDLPAGQWRAEHGIGTTFADGSIPALRGTLQGLISDAAKRAQVAASGYESVLREFSYDSIAHQLEHAMTQAIAER